MKIKICLLLLFSLFNSNSFSQTIADLKLRPKEIPKGYTLSDGNNCVSIQACTFYNDIETYSNIVGTVKSKSMQSFKSRPDTGSIMYFEFEHAFKGERFLQGLLWGKGGQPTDEHPEEYVVKGKFLVIWSFHPDSPVRERSETKIEAVFP
ncbi:hypothetical protein [Flavobacterium fluviatile]|uniref:hypothetical protein n=1 Tax=Flavobacterium fluviatile TaxID=1862387 RepID=UPI0013D1527F|nr:hypothetical protein [Flavobacterium fluviatile]